MENCDLLITGATVLTQDSLGALGDGAVALRGDRIVAVGPSPRVAARFAPARRIDAAGRILLPGLVNTHNHTPLMIVRGMVEDLGFAPAYTPNIPQGHLLSEEEAYALARLGAYELLRMGSTTVVDYYRHPQACARALAESGLRAMVGGRIHDVDTAALANRQWRYDRAIGAASLDENLALVERWHGAADGRITCMLAPHAADTCSRDLLEEVARIARARHLPVHTHLHQSEAEVASVQARDGMRPLALFETLGLLGPELVAAHCIWMTEDEIARAGRAGIRVAHAPIGNAAHGAIAPILALRDAGATITLCTDTKSADMFETMRTALHVARIRGAGYAIGAPEMLRWATVNGAVALGMTDAIGSITVGKKADLVLLDGRAPNLAPVIDGAGIVVHSATGANVDTVVIDGTVVLEGGRPLLFDGDAVGADAQRVASRLWQASGYAVIRPAA